MPYPEASIRRVWSIDGDFSLMLDTIPCPASLCELSGDSIELLRINKEYMHLTGDTPEHIYLNGTSVLNLVNAQDYPRILMLFRQALDTHGSTETAFRRLGPDGIQVPYHVKIRYMAGDAVRSLFFITYQRVEGAPVALPWLVAQEAATAAPKVGPVA